ncbi:MAG TPA: hypothetical protein VMM93_08935 [Vicinamibacterales bacterium]|nr:hypothetical protein [Vicinamibacterales bacterium]
MTSGRLAVTGLVLALFVGAGAVGPPARVAGVDLPGRLSNAEFWQIVEGWSEPSGYFRSDNLVSNEDTFQFVIPTLASTVRPGSVYMGVGPDQNFTYIAAVRPRIAFITDIRRGNLHVHLMYKALFEQASDRADFLSRLFARERPAGLDAEATPDRLFQAFAVQPPDPERFVRHSREIVRWLTDRRGFPLSDEDITGIVDVYGHFYASGPNLRYSNSGLRGRTRYPSFQDLQLVDDGHGVRRGYLSTEARFRFIKQAQERNLIVPLVGNFAGPRALRSVGAWVRERGGTVGTYYASNVEQYLFQDGLWPAFADNLSTLPLEKTSTLIRSCFNNCAAGPYRSWSMLDSMPALVADARAGRVRMYWDVLSRSR